jgi:hypothetical protein
LEVDTPVFMSRIRGTLLAWLQTIRRFAHEAVTLYGVPFQALVLSRLVLPPHISPKLPS